METIFFIVLGTVTIISALVGDELYDRYILKKLHKAFSPGAIVKFYHKTSNVFDTMDPNGEYEVLGSKGKYVRFRNLKTGLETDSNLEITYKYSDRCEVYHGDKMVALFTDDVHDFYDVEGKKSKVDNCS